MTSSRRLFIGVFLIAAFAACFGDGVDIVRSVGAQPTPAPTATMRPRTAPSPTPTPTAVTTASPGPTSPAKPVETVDQLLAKIRTRLYDPLVRRGRVGMKIVSLSSGKVVFEQDSEKYFMPASNMKNFTVAAALDKLGPDFRFVTSVYATSPPDTSGTVKGDIRVYGRGDISISTAFNNGDYYKGIDNLVDRIAAAGVKRIEGSIVGDESYFKGFYIPQTWEWDDLHAYYGAEVSALPINDNAVDVTVAPGPPAGPCNVSISPANTLFQINNICTTGGSRRTVRVVKRIDRNVLEISGSVPTGDEGQTTSVAVTRPAELFIAILKQRLEFRGIAVTGSTRMSQPSIRTTNGQLEIARLESAPLSLIAAKTMKPSQNMFTEVLLWTLGEERGPGRTLDAAGKRTYTDADPDSSTLGINTVKAFLKDIGAAEDGILQYDGSGLSRHDLVTPSAVVSLYTYMAKQSKSAMAWRESLTIAGVDGTLANRMKGTVAQANFRGKTGTIDQVSALSGYVTTAAGEQLVVSMVVNNVGGRTSVRTSVLDDIAVALANFNGKVD
jgi:serine-type D-Ala-D-Ala carboxypeptidase/endopeptidase (penicillin-binding protein 4)